MIRPKEMMIKNRIFFIPSVEVRKLKLCPADKRVTMSSKNILQEYCQKRRLAIPQYQSYRASAETEAPLFRSTVRFMDHEGHGSGPTKTAAEQEAAKAAWEQFSRESSARAPAQNHLCAIDPAIVQCGAPLAPSPLVAQQKYATIANIPDKQFQIIYLIDGDNCNVTNEQMFADQGSLFIYFIAKNCTKPFPVAHQMRYVNCCIFISDTVARDAADHLLSFSLGQMTVLWKDKKYIIVTRDHFGEVLARLVPHCQFVCAI